MKRYIRTLIAIAKDTHEFNSQFPASAYSKKFEPIRYWCGYAVMMAMWGPIMVAVVLLGTIVALTMLTTKAVGRHLLLA